MLRWYEYNEDAGLGLTSLQVSDEVSAAASTDTSCHECCMYLLFSRESLLTGKVLFGTGDVLAQQAVEKKGSDKHDLARTGRMALYGGCKSYRCSESMEAHNDRCLWTCCHQMVSVLTEQHQSADHLPNDGRSSPRRSDSLRPHQYVCLLVEYVHLRRKQSTREVEEELYPRSQGQLDSLACSTISQLHDGAFGTQSLGCQHRQLGLELLLKLSQLIVTLESRCPELAALGERLGVTLAVQVAA